MYFSSGCFNTRIHTHTYIRVNPYRYEYAFLGKFIHTFAYLLLSNDDINIIHWNEVNITCDGNNVFKYINVCECVKGNSAHTQLLANNDFDLNFFRDFQIHNDYKNETWNHTQSHTYLWVHNAFFEGVWVLVMYQRPTLIFYELNKTINPYILCVLNTSNTPQHHYSFRRLFRITHFWIFVAEWKRCCSLINCSNTKSTGFKKWKSDDKLVFACLLFA